MLRTWCFGLALAALGAAVISCSSDPDQFVVRETVCVPGQQVACACPGGYQGAQACLDDGSGYAACQCAYGGCTAAPDCGGCNTCAESCACQNGGNADGCEATCGGTSGTGGSSGSGGSGGGSARECNADDECSGGIGTIATPCCGAAGKCGVKSSFLGNKCIEKSPPGTPDADCPSQSLQGFNLEGCCREDGKCGISDPLLGLGCVDAAAILGGGSGGGQSCGN